MRKTQKYAINFALAGGIINAAINLIRQLNAQKDYPSQIIDWQKVTVAGFQGAMVGGVVGGVAGAYLDDQNNREIPQNTDVFLHNIIHSVALDCSDRRYQKLLMCANALIQQLQERFGSMLATPPLRGGSTFDGTALKEKFDIDIYLSFAPRSFPSTRNMFNEVLTFLDQLEGKMGIVDIRDQKKSIGVYFNIDGIHHKIDIVPQKRSKSGKHATAGYLFVNNSSFFSDCSTYTKTDFETLRNQRLTSTQKKIILVLKHWKNKNDLPLSSHLLKNLVLDAYKQNWGNIPKSFTKKVILVLQHIVNILDFAVIRSVENTNNIITNLPSSKKSEIIQGCRQVLEDYNYQPNSLLHHFSVD